jgi:hypothetical protein
LRVAVPVHVSYIVLVGPDDAPPAHARQPPIVMTEKSSLAPLLDWTARVRAAFIATPLDETVLEEAVCGYVAAAKTLDWPVERVIVELKRIGDVEGSPVYQRLRDPMQRTEARELMQRVVAWSIDQYFQP